MTPAERAEIQQLRNRIAELERERQVPAEIIRKAPVMISIMRAPDFVYELVNPAFQAFAPGKEFLGRRFADVWAEVSEPLVQILQHVIETGQTYSLEDAPYTIQRAPGAEPEVVYVSSSWIPLPGPSGRPDRILSLAHETTQSVRERQQLASANDSLAQAKKQYRRVLASIAEGYFALDDNWIFMHLNAAAERSFSRPAADLVGRNIWEVMGLDAGSPLGQVLNEAVVTRLPIHREQFGFFQNRWLELHLYPREGCLDVYFHDITERKQAEGALRESEAQFRTLANAIPQLCWMAHADGWIFWYNQRWYEYTGKTPEEMEGWGWQSVHDPEVLPKVLERWKHSLEAGEAFDMVFPLRGADGVFRPFLTRVMPVRDQEGRIVRWFGTNTDISEQRRAEEALRTQAELLKLSYDAMIVWRLDGPIESWNLGAERLYGFTEAEALGRVTHELLATVHPKPWDEMRNDLLATGSWEGELRHRTRDGRDVVVSSRHQLIRGADGVERVLETNRDITDQQQAEEALRRSEGLLRAITDSIDDNIFLKDRQARMLLANPRVFTDFGQTSVIGKTDEEIFLDPVAAKATRADDERVMGTGRTELIEETIRTTAGDRVFLTKKTPWRDPEGNVIGLVGIARDITERKQAERALQQHREWLRVTLASIGDAVLATDTEGRIAFLNPSAAGLTGWTAEEAFGRPAQDVFRVIDESTRTAADDVIRRALDEKRVVSFTANTLLLSRDGREIPIEDSAAPIRDSAGGIAGAVLVFQDVTEKRRAQAALLREQESLRQLNRTLRAISRSNQALMLATDEPSYLREVCRIVVEDCQYPLVWVGYREDDEAKTVRPVAYSGFEEGYLETAKITWADTARGGGPTGTAVRTGKTSISHDFATDPRIAPWRDEAIRRGYASSISLPLLDGDRAFGALTIYSRRPNAFSEDEVNLLAELAGDLAYGVNVLRLREAHARAEQELRESEARFRSVVESNMIGVVFSDAVSGHISDANDEFLRIIGRSREDLLAGALNWKKITPAASLAYEEKLTDTVPPGKPISVYEKEYIRPDGSRVPVLIGASLLGGPHNAVAFVLDNTEHKRAEERLRQSQKLESIGLLAGGIAHDFNNLLTGMIGNASLVLEEVAPGTAERVRQIVTAGERAAHLTSQLLAYSGKGQFILQDLDLSQVAHEMADMLRVSVPANVDLSINIRTRLPLVRIDPGQLQQILMNLVINAGEAIGEGGPGKIAVVTSMADVDRSFIDALGREVAPGRYVLIEVSDTGPGISEENRSSIFDPFFTTKFQGRGLGLAAVAGIVRAQKGGIVLESAPGQGSTFRIFLPAAEREVQGREEPRGEPERATVLVVDDDASVRDVMAAVLQRQGYRALMASDGREALAVSRREKGRIDAAIIDVFMPLMGAGELLPKLKSERPDIKVLLTSGYGEAEAKKLGAMFPDTIFVQKPYTAQKIARAIDELLRPQG